MDLPAYLRRHERGSSDEAAALASIGRWLATELLGEIAERAPVTIEVCLTAEAAALLQWPLEEVLAEVQELRDQMATLPEQSALEERVNPWNVREVALDAGRPSPDSNPA